MASKEQEDAAYADAMSATGASVLRAFGICNECGCEECECSLDARLEAVLADAVANENVELIEECETALKLISAPHLKRRAIERINAILAKEAA